MNPRLHFAEIDSSPEAAMTRACGLSRHDPDACAATPVLRPDSEALLEEWIALLQFAPPLLFLFTWARLMFASYLQTRKNLLKLAMASRPSTRGVPGTPVPSLATTAASPQLPDSFERAMDLVLGPEVVVYAVAESFEPATPLAAAAGKA